jgi:hypothetical protein
LGQQRWHLRWILLVALGHRRGDDLPLIIDTDMEFLPALDLLLPMFLAVSLPLATDL